MQERQPVKRHHLASTDAPRVAPASRRSSLVPPAARRLLGAGSGAGASASCQRKSVGWKPVVQVGHVPIFPSFRLGPRRQVSAAQPREAVETASLFAERASTYLQCIAGLLLDIEHIFEYTDIGRIEWFVPEAQQTTFNCLCAFPLPHASGPPFQTFQAFWAFFRARPFPSRAAASLKKA